MREGLGTRLAVRGVCVSLPLLSYFIPQYVVDKLFWPETPLLEAVGLHEPAVEAMRDAVSRAITQALVPLRAYSRQYEHYLDLINLDIKTYIE